MKGIFKRGGAIQLLSSHKIALLWTPQRPSPHPCSNMFAEEGPLPFAKVRIFEVETIPSILPFSAPPQCG